MTWSTPVAVASQSRVMNQLTGVSCPTSGLCVAVDAAGNVLTSTSPTGGSAAWSQPVAIDTGHQLSAVACPSASLCVAVDDAGNAFTATSPTGGASAWNAKAYAPGVGNGAGDSGPADVSCPSASFCVVAYGQRVYATADPADGATATWTSSGTSVNTTTENSPNDHIACASASVCVVGDTVGYLFSSTNLGAPSPSWTVTGNGVLSYEDSFGAIACPSTSLCIASNTPSGALMYSTTPGAGPWSSATLTQKYNFQSLACIGGSCIGGDFTGHIATTSNPAAGANAWSGSDVDATHDILDVSCPSASLCVASDDAGNVLSSTNPFAASPTWAAAHVDSATGSGALAIASLSCASATLCVGAANLGPGAFGAGDSYAAISTNPTSTDPSAWALTALARIMQ